MKSVVDVCDIRPFYYLSKRIAYVFLVLLLSGCVSQPSQFTSPEKIYFQSQIFERITHNELGDMQQMLYLPKNSEQNPENWQQGVLIFLDKNSQGRSLQERMELRKTSFLAQTDTLAKVEIIGVELQSQVIYPPTERFPDVQLEVTRGKEFRCGYGQMQFANKQSISSKNLQDLSQYQSLVAKMAQDFAELAWQIGCE